MIRYIGLSFPLHRTFVLFLCALCGAGSVACGRKGPPLAPIVYLPRAVTDFGAKRVEDEVVVQFTVPTLNTDGTGPADLRRVEVYAHTGPLPAPTDFQKYGTLVASIEIADPEKLKEENARPPGEGGNTLAPGVADATEQANASAEAGSNESASQVGRKMTEQGWLISVREPLTDKEREAGPMPPVRAPAPAAPNAPVVEKLETPGTENFELTPTRFYTAVGVSRSRGRRGPYAGPLRVPLVEPLMPPAEIAVAVTETAISLTWPRQPEDAVPPPTATAPPASTVPAAGKPAAPAPGAPPPPVPTTAPSPAPSDAAPVPAPPADAPPVAAPPPATVPPPVPAPAAPARVAPPVAMQETAGTYEVYADVETEDTRDVAPPAPPATPGAKPLPAAAAALAAAAKAAAAGPAPRYGYNVYDAPAAASTSAPALQIASASARNATADKTVDKPNSPRSVVPTSPTLPLNKTLLTVTTFADARIEFGVERCYVIRRVEMSSGVAIEGVASKPTCVTPKDTFPPAAPKNVQAISSGTGVTLLWEANTESDFGGYVVLRGEAPGDKLSPLTPSPISDTSFNDTTARRGRTYVYEVVAIDKQTPANRSEPSNRVEETIR